MTRPLGVRLFRIAVVGALLLAAAASGRADAATLWSVTAKPGSKGAAQGSQLPAAPTGVTATCSAVALQITVAWSPVSRATGYTIWQSTTGSSGTYTSVATVGGAVTTWLSPVLVIGTYYYKVSATVGTNWAGPKSAASAGHTITVALCS